MMLVNYYIDNDRL